MLKTFLKNNAGWLCIVLLCLLPIIRWFSIANIEGITQDRFLFFSALSKIFAITGTVLYAVNFVLALRAGWLEGFFGGMNKVYIAHHMTGALALFCLAMHPMFISVRYLADFSSTSFRVAADALLPDAIKISEGFVVAMESAAINFGSLSYFGLVILMLVTLFIKLPYSIWLKTHKFLGLSFLFAGLHIVYVSSEIKNDLPLRLYLVVLVGIGLAAFVHRSLLPTIFVQRFRYIVSSVRVNNGVVSIALSPEGKHIPFRAGQFVFVQFTNSRNVKKEMHPFSLVSREGSDNLELQIKYLGDYTSTLGSLEVGTKARVEGAFGRFSPYMYRSGPQVWIAGGIGVTPFLSAARSFKSDIQDTWLFYSVNERRELINSEEFESIVTSMNEKFHYIPYVKAEKENFLDVQFIENRVPLPINQITFFLCGPPVMMQSIKQQLIEKGVKKRHIISEEFSIQ